MSSATRLSELGTDSDRTLSSAEAAEFLGISVKTLNNWRVKGRGPAYVKYAGAIDGLGRQRGSVAYRLGDLREFVAEHRVGTTSSDESVSRHITALVDAAPRLNDEQIARLRVALGGAA
ncbi:helix-turn-helix domain-containing protein [Corynebacterium mayonis]|uniref:helix-turn-helix domain-containing protein n=1 Tax=Corynebacterium mayonis TaxID=3062461 RepID=UPI00313FE41D